MKKKYSKLPRKSKTVKRKEKSDRTSKLTRSPSKGQEISDTSSAGISKHKSNKLYRVLFKKIRQRGLRNNALLIALIIGFILRLVPILWGIPIKPYIRSYHPDEGKVLNSIFRFPEIYWTTKPFPGYGTAVQYMLGFLLTPFKFIFAQLLNLRFKYYIAVSIISRLTSIIFGTGSIYLVYLIGKKIYDENVALLSALFLSVSFYPTLNSPLITLDVSMSFILMLNFFLCIRAIEKNRMSDYILLGVASGLLVGIKTVSGIFFCIPCILSYLKLYYPKNDYDRDRTQFLKQTKLLISYILIAIVVFIVFHPHIFLDLKKYIAFYLREKHDWVDRARGSIFQLFSIWGKNTVKSLGIFVSIFALIGAVLPGRKNLNFKLMFLLFIVLYYGFWRWLLATRYIIAVAPIMCIFAANACMLCFYKKNILLRTVSMVMITVALVYSLYCCVSGISLRLNDTRPLVSKFIAENVPKGTTLGISSVSEKYNWRTHPWRYPKINFKQYRMVNFLSEPDIVVLSSYDYEPILKTLKSGKLLKNYVLPKEYHKDWYRYSAPSPRIFKFYDDLLIKKSKKYFLLKIFRSNVNVPLEFPPPEIRIYKKMI